MTKRHARISAARPPHAENGCRHGYPVASPTLDDPVIGSFKRHLPADHPQREPESVDKVPRILSFWFALSQPLACLQPFKFRCAPIGARQSAKVAKAAPWLDFAKAVSFLLKKVRNEKRPKCQYRKTSENLRFHLPDRNVSFRRQTVGSIPSQFRSMLISRG
jgi:hypothetical protein